MVSTYFSVSSKLTEKYFGISVGGTCTSVAVVSIEAISELKGYLHDLCLVFSVAL